MGIEATVEPDHQRRIAVSHHLQAVPHPVGIKVDRLLTEDGLAGAGALFNLVCVQVGRGADHHCVDGGVRDDVIDRPRGGTEMQRDVIRRCLDRIGHSGQHSPVVAADGPGMHPTDTPGTQNCKIDVFRARHVGLHLLMSVFLVVTGRSRTRYLPLK